MKAITIYQPWASLIAIGAKEFETRSWSTSYRGPIAIHAAKNDNFNTEFNKIFDSITAGHMIRAFNQAGELKAFKNMPLGCIVAVAELVDVIKTDNFIPSHQERLFGDWSFGRYAWKLANVTMLTDPAPARGKQGLWNWEGGTKDV